MSRERQAKPVPSVWPKNGPLGTLFLTHGLAWTIYGFWRYIHRALTDSLAFVGTGRNGDRVPLSSFLFHSITPCWRSDSHNKRPDTPLCRITAPRSRSLADPTSPLEEGRGLPAYLFFLSPINHPRAFVATPWRRSWPYTAIRGQGREKFPVTNRHPLMVGKGAG